MSIIMRRSLQQDEKAIAQLRADRSPTQILLQAVLRSLTDAQDAEARRLLGNARKLRPEDPAIDEALWMLRWLP